MPELNTKGIALLKTTTGVPMNGSPGTTTTLYTVPTGKTAYVFAVLVRDTSATLAGGTDFDFTGWRQTVDLSGMTTASTRFCWINAETPANYTEVAAAATFQITPTVGSSGAATATIDVFGFLA